VIRLFIIMAIIGTLAGCSLVSAAPSPAEPTVAPAGAEAGVTADGTVLPAADVTLRFERAGTVAAILVAEGEQVAAGQPLARLDARQLELRVAEARTGLERAQARYSQAAAGAAPEAVAVAEAGVAQARARLAEARAGITGADLAAAEAQLAEAQAALAAVLDGPKTTEVAQAEAVLDQARAGLAQQRDALSAAKTTAELAMAQAANNLRERQQAYERIYWDNRDLEALPGDLPDERLDMEESALRAVEDAETQLAQARVAFDQARQAEAEGVAGAEAGVRDAQARLDQLTAAPDADRVAAARARVAAAEANLDQLRGASRAAQLESVAVGVSQAEAQLAQSSASPREVDLAVARVEVEIAQVALDQAELDLAQATLLAPFAGTVARIDLEPGALAGPDAPALVLADMSAWRVETEDLTELEVVRLREGDVVTVRFDALPELELAGVVHQIKPIGTNRQGDIVYTVVVGLEEHDPRLRWNMTAVVTSAG
jgi:HlyD family secretion protein